MSAVPFKLHLISLISVDPLESDGSYFHHCGGRMAGCVPSVMEMQLMKAVSTVMQRRTPTQAFSLCGPRESLSSDDLLN